jgi:CRP/FNR family transcriptional regulator, cyclic AMP receptor protein
MMRGQMVQPWVKDRRYPMKPATIVELLGKTALFGSLSEEDRGAIASRMRQTQFEPDQMIFSRGDPGRDLYLVLEGRIRLSILSGDGRELSFAHAGPGSVFGEIATLDGGERTAGATAISRVQAMALPQKALNEVIENNPKVAAAAIHFLCQRLRDTDQRLEAIALHRIEVRLARLLLGILKLEAPNAKGPSVPLDLGMSQGEIALLIGASRPKVNIALTLLEEMGAIKRAGSKLTCDTEALEGIAEAE